MADQAPFYSLGLSAYKRQLQADADATVAPGQPVNSLGYWTQRAGQAGLDARDALLDAGIGFTSKDRKAIAEQKVMETAQMDLSEAVKNGLDPLDAQEFAISNAMSSLMGVGNFEAADQLIPKLAGVRKHREELQKLKTEQDKNSAAAEASTASAELRRGDDRRKDARNPAQIAADEALAEQRLAAARLSDRTDPNRKGKAGEGEDGDYLKMDAAQRTTLANALASTVSLADSMDDLSKIYETAVGAGTRNPLGQTENVLGQFLKGANAYFESKGSSVNPARWKYEKVVDDSGKETGQSVEDLVKAQRGKIKRQAVNLNISSTVLESLIIDAAYALARAREPGGRLSNNDFDYALKQLGAVQDPQSALAAFAAIEERAYRQTMDRFTAYSPEAIKKNGFQYGIDRLKERHDQFAKARGGFAFGDNPPPGIAAPAAKDRPPLSQFYTNPQD